MRIRNTAILSGIAPFSRLTRAVILSIGIMIPMKAAIDFSVTPAVINLRTTSGSADPVGANITITNLGDETIVDHASALPSWGFMFWTHQKLATGASETGTFYANAQSISPGEYSCVLQFMSGSVTKTVTVNLTVDTPTVKTDVTAITLGSVERSNVKVYGQVLLTVTGAPVNCTATSDASWLDPGGCYFPKVNQPNAINIGAITPNLGSGTYKGTVTISPQGFAPIKIQVTFNVAPRPVTTAPPSFTFTVQSGKYFQAPLVVTAQPGENMNIDFSNPGSWIAIEPQHLSSFPAATTVYIDATHLMPGSYSTSIQFRNEFADIDATVPVSLTVTDSADLIVFPSMVNATADTPGSGVQNIQMFVTNRGQAVNYTTSGSQQWVQITPASGTLKASGDTPMTVQLNPTGLTPGTYKTDLMITAPNRNALTIPVALRVGGAQVSVSPSYFSFSTNTAQTLELTDNITVSNTGTTSTFSASADKGWVKITPSSGDLLPNAPVTLRMAVDPRGLGPGHHAATVTVNVLGQLTQIPVTLTIQEASLTVKPTSLQFQLRTGQVSTQNVTITKPNEGSATITAVTQSGGPWLSVSQSKVTAAESTIVVKADTASMARGNYSGTIRVTYSNGGSTLEQLIPVALLLSDSTDFRISPERLEFQMRPGITPMPQTVSVYTDHGGPAAFTAMARSAGGWLSAQPNGAASPGMFTVSVDPGKILALPAAGTIDVTMPPPDSRLYQVQVVAVSQPASIASMPQIADGGGFVTSITLVNQDTVDARVSLKFRRERPDGSGATDDWLPKMVGDAATEDILIPSGSAYTLQTTGAGEAVESGWAQVLSAQKVGGFAVFRQRLEDGTEQEAAVPINRTTQQRILVPFDNTNGFVTSMAFANLSDAESCRIQYVIRDESGRVASAGSMAVLPELGHSAFRLIDVAPGSDGIRGTAEFISNGGRPSALALRFNGGGAFTSFEAQDLGVRDDGRMIIPQVADGGGFKTSVTLVNNDVVPAEVSVVFRRCNSAGDAATAPWSPEIAGGASLEKIVIPAGLSYTFSTAGTDKSISSGWAEVLTRQSVKGMAVFQLCNPPARDQEAAVPMNSGARQHFGLAYDNTGGFVTSMAMVNASADTPSSVIVVVHNDKGVVTAAEVLSIPASGHMAFELPNRFPKTAGMKGVVEFTTTGKEVSILGLRFSPKGAFTSFRAEAW